MSQAGGFFRTTAFLFVLGGLIGFGGYSGLVSSYETPDTGVSADAIVILTGDEGRLAAGGQLLSDGQAGHLLISGVHPSVTIEDIRRHTSIPDTLFDCCVLLGREATDTAGNALETANWAAINGHQSLIIVTSDYHLPRSLLEMQAIMPNLELIPYPVYTDPPWRNPGTARLWVQEYAKFTAVWMKNRLSGYTS
jgi:uncharacterized SAM-binding protein YcdF (DUF218 family)